MTQDNSFKKMTSEGTQGMERKTAGRPMVDLDFELIQHMLDEGTPVKEIGDFFNCTVQSIYNHCGEMVAQAKTLRKLEIRSLQNAAARAGNVPMLIHLGKTELKQSEAAPTEVDAEEEDKGVQWEVDVMVVEKPVGLTVSERAELEGQNED